MSIKLKWILVISLLSAFFVFQFYHLLFQLPEGIHEWAQADRLALAYGYYENGMNFLKPSTLSQYSTHGITGVEFPIQAYIVAGIAKVFGKGYISIIFRLFDTAIIFISLIALINITYRFTKNIIIASLAILPMLVSPSFLNYTCSYMPDTVSAVIAMVGMALYIICWTKNKKSSRYWALLLLTLASLIKTSTALYLLSFVGFDLLQLVIKNRKEIILYWRYYVAIVLSLGSLVYFYLHNQVLNNTYHSTLFLADIKPMSLADFKYLIGSRIKDTWAKEYFVLPFYIILFIVSIGCFIGKSEHKKFLFIPLFLIQIIGIISVSYLMGHQFIDHDYYFISIYFPFIFFLFFWFTLSFSNLLKHKVFQVGIILIYIFFLGYSYSKTQARLSPTYPSFSDYYRTFWMKNGDRTLTQLGIPNDALIGVLDEDAPNLALVYFNRKGFVIDSRLWNNDFQTCADFFKTHHITIGLCERKHFDTLIKVPNSFDSLFTILYQNDQLVMFKCK